MRRARPDCIGIAETLHSKLVRATDLVYIVVTCIPKDQSVGFLPSDPSDDGDASTTAVTCGTEDKTIKQ